MISKIWSYDCFRFIVIGVLNTFFGYGVYALFIVMGVDYKISILFSTMLGILFNYITIGKVVFRKDSSNIFRFIAVYGIVCFSSIIFVKLGLLLGVNTLAGGAIALIPSAITSYCLNKLWVFRSKKI